MAWTVVMDCGKEYLPGLVSTGISSVSRVPYKGTRKRPPQCMAKNEVDDDDLTEKKRRLTLEQVNFLETSFTMDPKLEPERKDLIAKQLGVRPRQVAIWFQNRRARWKNKQVEQDYESLKASYDVVLKEKESLAEEYESALEGNKRLQAEVTRLKSLVQGIKDKDATRKLSPAKEEQQSDKSELMSPTKSADEQSEIEDLLIPSDVAEVATMTNPSVESSNSAVACGVRLEGEWPPFLPSESVFSSVPLLVQQLVANGYCFEDAYDIFLGCENSFMVGWHDMCDKDF